MKPMALWALPMSLFSLTIGFDLRFWPDEETITGPSANVTAAPRDLIQCRTYLLPEERKLELDLPSDVVRIRLLVNAALEPDVRETLQRGVPPIDFPLELIYEILDADGNLLLEGHGDFQSRIHGSFHTELNQPIVGGFFKQSELLPGSSHELSLSLDRFQGRATKVTVRLGSHAPEIREAVLRSYALIGRSEGFDEYLWDRTSPTWRERLTRTNLYPPELVSESERQNLLRHRWSSVPPSGIDGTDYEERILCLFRDFHEPTRIESLPVALVNPVGPHWRSGIPLPDPAGTLRLEFTWHEISEALPNGLPAGAVVRWHAPEAARNTSATAIPESPVSEIELSVEGGMIEIESPHLAEVRAWWRPEGQSLEQVLQSNGGLQKIAPERLTPGGEVDITPEPIIRKVYRTDPGTTVEFSVSHLSGESTPLRVILQQPMMADDREAATGNPKLTWEFLDLQGQVTHSGVIEYAAPLSEYERIDEQTPIQNVGEPATRYFAVPDHVSVVRFGSVEHSM
ncbi:MAG TPA: hypothetical protein VLA12_01625, partial [Planctomycetaceae bacterium]|nr:hypothetical protein [Planctomycetaceae bacterium]